MISIIIRGKNEAQWLRRLYPVLKTQTIDFELIYIDNNSTDKSIELTKEFFPNSKCLTIEKFKPGKALNMGINEASGDILVFLSSHCIPTSKEWLDVFSKPLINNNFDVSYGRQISFNETGDLSVSRELRYTFKKDSFVQKNDYFFHNAHSIVKKKIFGIEMFDEKVEHVEDLIWARAIQKLNIPIFYNADACVYHFHGIGHGNNISRFQKINQILYGFDKEDRKFDQNKPLRDIDRLIVFDRGKKNINQLLLDLNEIHSFKVKQEIIDDSKKYEFDHIQQIFNYFSGLITPHTAFLYFNSSHEKFSSKNVKYLVEQFILGSENSLFYGEVTHENIFERTSSGLTEVSLNLLNRSNKNETIVSCFGAGLIVHYDLMKTGKIHDRMTRVIKINENK